MKIFDAVYTAAVFLQLDSLSDALSSEDFDKSAYGECLPQEDATELELLIRCCNLVLSELSESDFPLKTVSVLRAADGKINYSQFPQKVTDIYSVTSGGKSVPFCEYYDCVTVPVNGECEVTYSFAPPAVTLSDSSPYSGNKPSARLAAYGIAREYCLISGMTDDAAMWDNRFVACVEEEARAKKCGTVRPRRWL